MNLLALFAVQGLGGMSSFPPPQEELHFLFVSDEKSEDREWNIRGSATMPTEWYESTFLGIVEQCGGRKVSLVSSYEQRIGIMSNRGREHLEIARCVKASTSVRFAVTVKHRAYGRVSFDKLPFRTLWNR